MTKILLVEDDKSLREIYGVRLLAEGYDIVSAGDGEAALAMAIKERPDLIISDVMMPKISGFDMLDILRSTTETRDIKVIMMTALSSDDQRARGEQLGADRYLVKSQVGIEDVVRTVHEVMNDSGKVVPTAATPVAEPVTASSENTATSAATPAPEPITPSTPSAPVATEAETEDSEPSSLPQPTAPFSSPKPDNLGERVINPISMPAPSDFVGSQINEELAAAGPTDTPAAEPVEEPAGIPSLPPQPQGITADDTATPAQATTEEDADEEPQAPGSLPTDTNQPRV